MRYLIIDAELNGSGIKDEYEGTDVHPKELKLNHKIVERLDKCLPDYAIEKYQGYKNDKLNVDLDREGKDIAKAIKHDLGDVKVQYFSDARSTKEII